jgi:LytS/YehU family sensor histidine kinase
MLLVRQRYAWFSMITILYFIVVSALVNWGITYLFYFTNQEEGLIAFYNYESHYYRRAVFNPLLAYPDVLTDLLAFMSILLMRYAFENERKKHLLEKSNLELQLQTLKAQLQPHFLFNTLNSIYGMSLVNSVDTPAFILRLSDMMRYILYDCQQHLVPLEKDVRFLGNYLEMEKKRYPESNIVFVIEGDPGEKKIAPLLFIQFMENSFKHGAYRLGDRGFVEGALRISDKKVIFHIANDMLAVTGAGAANGGVGIENVRQRLEIHYPGRHRLMIQNDGKIFTVELTIQL